MRAFISRSLQRRRVTCLGARDSAAGGIVAVFDLGGCAIDEHGGNLCPARALEKELLKNKCVFLFGPSARRERGLEMVHPTVAALLGSAAWHGGSYGLP